MTDPTPAPVELESRTGHLFPANVSAPSGELVRRTLAEVERLLGEMRARDLGAPRAAAEAELDKARRREWCGSQRRRDGEGLVREPQGVMVSPEWPRSARDGAPGTGRDLGLGSSA